MRVLLVGMMGAGKTTVGRLLASRLHCRYLDSDQQVEARTGRTVAELFADGGEPAFRSFERDALADAVATDDSVVVAVAGGAVLDPGNRALLRRSGTVVWLRARPATLAARVEASGDHHRPLLGDDPGEALERLDAVRRPLYAEVADVVIDVDDLTPEAVADQVLAKLCAAP